VLSNPPDCFVGALLDFVPLVNAISAPKEPNPSAPAPTASGSRKASVSS